MESTTCMVSGRGRIGAARLAGLLWVAALSPHIAHCGDEPGKEPRAAEAAPAAKLLSPVELFSTRAPAVVRLTVHGEGAGPVGYGSGFIVAAPSPTTRHVLTNYHVIQGGVHAEAEFHDGSFCTARELIAEDPTLDLAVLLLELDKPRDPAAQAIIDVRNAEEPPVGTRLYAIGSPVGMKNTLSDGLLSGYRSGDSDAPSVQMTAPISPGSSGGPVFSEAGAFVGVATATRLGAQNVNFAVSARRVREFLNRKNNPRPLWRGSCIECEEQALFRSFYEAVYRSFRETAAGPSPLPVLHATSSDPLMWAGGSLPFHGGMEFRKYCEARAKESDLSALLLMGSFHRGAASKEGSDSAAHLGAARDALAQALSLADDDKFFVLFKMAEVYEMDPALRTEAWASALAKVLSTLQASRDQNPRFSPTAHEIAHTLLSYGRFHEALPVSEELVRLVPNSARAHAQKATILKGLGSRLAAIDELRIAVELNPYDTALVDDSSLQLGILLAETGQHEKAIEVFRQSLAAQAILEADALRQAKRDCESRHDCDDPDHKQFVSAMQSFQRLVAQVWITHWWIARELVVLKRFEEAREAYRAALAAAKGVADDSLTRLEQDLAALDQLP